MLLPDLMTLGISMIVILLIVILGGIITSLFWVAMLVDCAKRDFKDKTAWIIIIIFTHFMGALLYYYNVKKQQENLAETQK